MGVERFDDYATAASHCVSAALKDPSGELLRSVKTLMDTAQAKDQRIAALEEELEETLKQAVQQSQDEHKVWQYQIQQVRIETLREARDECFDRVSPSDIKQALERLIAQHEEPSKPGEEGGG